MFHLNIRKWLKDFPNWQVKYVNKQATVIWKVKIYDHPDLLIKKKTINQVPAKRESTPDELS